MDDKFTIRIRIDRFSHPVIIDRDEHEEELHRKAALLVESRFAKYRRKYDEAGLGEDAYYSLVALELAVKLLRLSESHDLDMINEQISELTREIEEHLESK